jgi:hypothetical protein
VGQHQAGLLAYCQEPHPAHYDNQSLMTIFDAVNEKHWEHC